MTKRSWRDVLPIHPAAELLPLMSEQERRELGDDIKENGLHVPITVWKGQKHLPVQLLDGRNRLDAIEQIGITIQINSQKNRCPGPFRSFQTRVLRNFSVGAIAPIQ